MAVPTIYGKLINGLGSRRARPTPRLVGGPRAPDAAHVSGSAALPVQRLSGGTKSPATSCSSATHDRDRMALSNPRVGSAAGIRRHAAARLEVRLVDEEAGPYLRARPGEIEVRARRCFSSMAAAGRAAARSGRLVPHRRRRRRGTRAYRILGRSSVDIIKDRGYKSLGARGGGGVRTHPAIARCVVGVEIPSGASGSVRRRAARRGGPDPRRAAGVAKERRPYKIRARSARCGSPRTPWVRSRRGGASPSILECQGAVKVADPLWPPRGPAFRHPQGTFRPRSPAASVHLHSPHPEATMTSVVTRPCVRCWCWRLRLLLRPCGARLAVRARSHHERGDQPSDHHLLGGGACALSRGPAGVRSRRFIDGTCTSRRRPPQTPNFAFAT